MSTGRSTTQRDRDRKLIARGKPDCALCLNPIDYSIKSPDPMSFEVDHIIPLAKGGTDELANKQAAHRQPILQPCQVAPDCRRPSAAHLRDSARVVNEHN